MLKMCINGRIAIIFAFNCDLHVVPFILNFSIPN